MGLAVQIKEGKEEKKETNMRSTSPLQDKSASKSSLQNKSAKQTILQNKCMYCGSAFADSVQLTHHLMKELKERTVKEDKETEDAKCETEVDEKKELKGRTTERDLESVESKSEKEVGEKKDLKERPAKRDFKTGDSDLKTEMDERKELTERKSKKETEKGDVGFKTELDDKKEVKEELIKRETENGDMELKVEVGEKKEERWKRQNRERTRKRRRLMKQGNTDNYKCVYCGLEFGDNLENLRIHKQRYKDSDQNLICPESNCGATFSNAGGRQVSGALKAHMNKHRGLSLVCPNCGKVYFSDEQLRSHMKEESKRTVHCEKCPQVFTSNEGLQRHIRMHDSQRKFPCKDCNLRFKALFVLQNHIKYSHEDVLEFMQCKVCEKIFKTDLAVQVHTRTVHNKERNYECTECSFKFFSNCKLSLHFKRKHMKTENMKTEDMKTEDMKTEDMKTENMKIENMKFETNENGADSPRSPSICKQE